jgi:hypothetical protein
VAALVASAALWRGAGKSSMAAGMEQTDQDGGGGRWLPVGCLMFVLGYLGVLVHHWSYLPVLSIDALVYHFPAAVQWLQRGRIGVFDVWYQPANAYSPLAGSVFIAWLMAPVGNSVLARYVQMPPLVLLFLAMVQLVRALGLNRGAAALLATGVVLSRPFISHTTLPKDDLFAVAFFAAAAAGLARQRPAGERLGPWRVGTAMGLLLATKYTVLFSVPLFILMVDAPVRTGWRWKGWAVAAGLVVALAGPWYLRNWVLMGNPIFPVGVKIGGRTLLPGLFAVKRSLELGNWQSVWRVLAHGYHSPPPWLMVLLLAGWAGAAVVAGREIVRRPLVRMCLLGPIVGVAVFLSRAMYAEVRFVYPSLLLLFGCSGVLLARAGRREWARTCGALLVGACAAATGFVVPLLVEIVTTSAIVTGVGMGLMLLRKRVLRLRPAHLARLAVAAALALAMLVYVYWAAYVGSCELAAGAVWTPRPPGYGPIAEAWTFVREKTGETATIAYANTNLVYPLQGFRQQRRVLYVPTRRDVPAFAQMPRLGDRLAGEETITRVNVVLQAEPDRQAWLERLKASGAEYLFIAKGPDAMVERPVELELVGAERERFAKVFESAAAEVYQIRWDHKGQ